jgi:PHP family Zn ribbon phosphoesterase
MEINVCEWTFDLVDDFYQTTCGNAFTFTEGDPEDNYFIYCPYCGFKIKEGASHE